MAERLRYDGWGNRLEHSGAVQLPFGFAGGIFDDDTGLLRYASSRRSDVIDYVIDGFDRRIGKKKNGVVQKQWLYRDGLRIAAELDGAGHVVSRFVYASRSNVPDFLVRQHGTYRIVSDHLGSTVLVANISTGQVVQTRERRQGQRTRGFRFGVR